MIADKHELFLSLCMLSVQASVATGCMTCCQHALGLCCFQLHVSIGLKTLQPVCQTQSLYMPVSIVVGV